MEILQRAGLKGRVPEPLRPFLRQPRKYALRILLNLRYRRPFWSGANLASLHRMVDRRRVSPASVPVIINNFNRLESLRALVDWIQRLDGEKSIIILDNASTYPPLRDYYRALRASNLQVVYLGYNSGLQGIADAARELRSFRRYVVTDPDLVPYPDTPTDVLVRMDGLLDKYTRFNHVGASIEINDIPSAYPLKEEVVAWESKFWPPQAKRVGADGFEAAIDTTFAMYRSGAETLQINPAMRLDRPYTLKHVDWYIDPAHLTDEQRYYLTVGTVTASWTDKLRRSGHL